ncbi:MAG: PGPGW domain-containing protein [Acidimicrobiales bacterium]
MPFDFDDLSEAAIEAEFATGEHEETAEKARAHVLVRIGRMTLGFFVVILGLILMPLPGPGAVIVAAGLVILSKDVAWADRVLRWMRKKTPGIPEDGKIPPGTIAFSLLMMVAAFLVFWYIRANYDLPLIG